MPSRQYAAPRLLVPAAPAPIPFGGRSRVREFWADRHQIALDRQVERAGRFDRDVPAQRSQAAGERNQFGEQHRFAAGEHDVPGAERRDLLQNFVDA